MSQSSYWLQAALYLVALHRYLSANMQGYSITQHLGGATYLSFAWDEWTGPARGLSLATEPEIHQKLDHNTGLF